VAGAGVDGEGAAGGEAGLLASVPAHFPFQTGSRFSAKARAPSRLSSEP